MLALEAAHITKSFGPVDVLVDVDLTLRKGEIVGLLGRNGAGKSTLLKILAGINAPDQGTVNYNKNTIGYMSERNPLYPYMYVREYLQWVGNMKSVPDISLRIKWIIKHVGLEAVQNKKINQLSKGYRQRLGLAATLLPDPEIIILDEPINGLDPIQIEEYRALIRSMAHNKIILLSSHLMQEIEALCDRVLLLKDGVISEDTMLRTNRTGSVYQLELQLDKSIRIDLLANIDGIEKVEPTNNHRYIISIKEGVDPRSQIFDAIVDNKFRILEMTHIKSSLSQLFN